MQCAVIILYYFPLFILFLKMDSFLTVQHPPTQIISHHNNAVPLVLCPVDGAHARRARVLDGRHALLVITVGPASGHFEWLG